MAAAAEIRGEIASLCAASWAAPIPMEQIIQKFAANEDMMKKSVRGANDFTQTIRVEELGDPGGKFTVSGQMYTRPAGGASFASQRSRFRI